MSRLLQALRSLGLDEDTVEDSYDDDFLTNLQPGDSSDDEIGGIHDPLSELQRKDLFLSIVKGLPYELQLKIFRLSLGRFYESELLQFLGKERQLELLRPFYDDLLVCNGKLYFGSLNEFSVIKFMSLDYEDIFKGVIERGLLRIRVLKIYDLSDVPDDYIVVLLKRSERIWCATVSSLTRIYQLCPESLSRITDLSVENLDHLSRDRDVRPMFRMLIRSLKDLTLSLSDDEYQKFSMIFDILKDIDHPLTIHLPISYPADDEGLGMYERLLEGSGGHADLAWTGRLGGSGAFSAPSSAMLPSSSSSSSSSSPQVVSATADAPFPYPSNIHLSHILFTLAPPNFDLDDLNVFLRRVGYQKFSDFCFVSFPNFQVQGDLDFISELINLVSIVLSGDFQISADLSRLSKLKELMLDNCKLDCDWFNRCLPSNLKEMTFSYSSFRKAGNYEIPPNLKVLTILSNDGLRLNLGNLDFSKSNLSVLKFRVDDDSQLSKLSVAVKNLPSTLREINCYQLRSLVVEKDIKLDKKKDLVVRITALGYPPDLRIADLHANVRVRFKCYREGGSYWVGEIDRMDSIGGLDRGLFE
ncbi:DEKNAAC103297 [Brettanomyces naardenensis]|uniref:DEKNAAC103297 n=1 Tax=Brettanomyces naardenensis TaxID=13370 RepID=A0A448YN30_BRENA|nr:DEKNAAC103297 [Brettanomyces naardenensis]